MRSPSRRIRAAVPAALAAAALILAGCGGSGASNSRSTGSPAPPASSTSAPAQPTTPAGTTTPPPPAPTTTPSPWHPPTITPGTALPGEMISPEQATHLQESIDEGHQPWRVHADMVAEAYVRNHFGWEDIQVAMADPHTAEVTNRPDGHMLTLQLRQPVREGPTGIWVVVSGTYLG